MTGWSRPTNSDALAELESAHCYAAEFGTVLEWCCLRTDALFAPAPDMDVACLPAWDAAELAYFLVRDARTTERRLAEEAA